MNQVMEVPWYKEHSTSPPGGTDVEAVFGVGLRCQAKLGVLASVDAGQR
jgi:hypothetical protein